MFLYGNWPFASFFIFWILVFALSNGKLTKEDRKPDTNDALKNIIKSLLNSNAHCLWAVHSCHELLLDLVIWCQHSQVQSYCSDDSWGSTSPQSQETFFFCDSWKRIKNAAVVSSFSDWKSRISLHSDQGQIGWVSDQRSYESCEWSAVSFLKESQILWS